MASQAHCTEIRRLYAGAVVLTSVYYDPSAQVVSVSWAPDPTKVPFFGYNIRIFDNPGLTGTPIASVADTFPSARSVSISAPPPSGQYFVSMSATGVRRPRCCDWSTKSSSS